MQMFKFRVFDWISNVAMHEGSSFKPDTVSYVAF